MTGRIALIVLACGGASASADVIDFEGLEHGLIVDTQFADRGILVEAVNPNRSFDLAAVFNTNLMDTRDPDLQSPWSVGNLPESTDIGSILIIQENNKGVGDGIADRPDDEGRRAAGQLIFGFDRVVRSIGFDLVDLESATSESSLLELFRGDTLMLSIGFAEFEAGGAYDNGAIYGDNSLNRIGPIDVAGGFDRAVFSLGGSGGLDNISYVLPAPGAMGALGIGGLLAARRRR